MRLYLDDVRPTPSGWARAYTPDQAIAILRTGKVTDISFDHDLGLPEPENGHKVALWIEEAAFNGQINPLSWSVHSSNGPGRQNITNAMKSAERFWARSNCPPQPTAKRLDPAAESTGDCPRCGVGPSHAWLVEGVDGYVDSCNDCVQYATQDCLDS